MGQERLGLAAEGGAGPGRGRRAASGGLGQGREEAVDRAPDRERKAQIEFHQLADGRRFYNRIRNPFLWEKEVTLARRVAAQMPPGGKRLLEIGCGEGSNMYFLMRQLPPCDLVGVDFSVAKLGFLTQNVAHARVTCVCADALHLPFSDNQFDLVLCRDVLHHVNWAREAVVAEALRVLREGGALVIFEVDGRAFFSRVHGIFNKAERGLKDSTPSALLNLCRGHGTLHMEYVEAGFLVRALGFFLGWPGGGLKSVVRPIYGVAAICERTLERVLPKRKWGYMMLVVRPG